MATTDALLRRMPGRICGQTVDRDGKTCYVLTIQAREQHIRREKATSNICSNQALLATTATIYLAMMGEAGLTEVALQSQTKAMYLRDKLIDTGLFEPVFKGCLLYTSRSIYLMVSPILCCRGASLALHNAS